MKYTLDDINKWDDDPGIFYRWQNPEWEVGTESWGQIYASAEEAREAYEEEGLDPEDAVLPGKSCMTTLEEIMKFINSFDNDFVLLVFEGSDTYATGHDDEYVAEFYETIAVIDREEAYSLYEKWVEEM